MKKSIFILSLILTFCFISSHVAQAQMINYKRRNKNLDVKAQPAAQNKSTKKKMNYYKKTKAKAKQKTDEHQVTNRVERLYDLNRDGFLQKTEINDFYKDVVSSVKNKGTFRVSTDLLKQFDSNSDGKITRYEIKEIANQIN